MPIAMHTAVSRKYAIKKRQPRWQRRASFTREMVERRDFQQVLRHCASHEPGVGPSCARLETGRQNGAMVMGKRPGLDAGVGRRRMAKRRARAVYSPGTCLKGHAASASELQVEVLRPSAFLADPRAFGERASQKWCRRVAWAARHGGAPGAASAADVRLGNGRVWLPSLHVGMQPFVAIVPLGGVPQSQRRMTMCSTVDGNDHAAESTRGFPRPHRPWRPCGSAAACSTWRLLHWAVTNAAGLQQRAAQHSRLKHGVSWARGSHAAGAATRGLRGEPCAGPIGTLHEPSRRPAGRTAKSRSALGVNVCGGTACIGRP